MNLIKFIANKPWLNKESANIPTTAIGNNVPKWYKDGDRFYKSPDGKYVKDPMLGGKIPTWKACPAIYDILTSGYVLKTPCDIKISLVNGKPKAEVLDSRFETFLQERTAMPGFEVPHGYHKDHFAFFSFWGVQTPKGYSVIYSHPFNRYDLPFLSTNGIIDNDSVSLPGSLPFFVKTGWDGVIPAGTPYIQLIPFKREDWSSEIVEGSPLEIHKANVNNSKKFRVPDGGVYQTSVWTRRKYS